MAFTSLITGSTGLRTSQQTLDVVGNNLANSNTTAFKAQRTLFADLFYQTLAGATPPSGNTGGTNPLQVGFGVELAAIDNILTQGVLNPTGREFDAAIEGNGFFVVTDGLRTLFTRAGSFNVNSEGYLVESGTGFYVQRTGTTGEAAPGVQGFQTPGDLRIRVPLGISTPGTPTSAVNVLGNLDATAAVGTTVPGSVGVFDTLGTRHTLSLTFTKTATGRWTLTGAIPPADGTMVDAAVGPIDFDSSGLPTSFNGDLAMTATFNGIPDPQTFTFDLGTIGQANGLTQFGQPSDLRNINQNGVGAGVLTTISIGANGQINGVFSNSTVLPLAQLAIANFRNPAGLSREGTNLFAVSAQSGDADIGPGQEAGRGAVRGGSLEQSNVDVVREFSELIVAQRTFQVNARSITVSSEILQDLANLIR